MPWLNESSCLFTEGHSGRSQGNGSNLEHLLQKVGSHHLRCFWLRLETSSSVGQAFGKAQLVAVLAICWRELDIVTHHAVFIIMYLCSISNCRRTRLLLTAIGGRMSHDSNILFVPLCFFLMFCLGHFLSNCCQLRWWCLRWFFVFYTIQALSWDARAGMIVWPQRHGK